ncbi:alpha/beta hydrolase [Caulobacter sp. NIBR2454]|uniref:alpha/beta hydrolase n=1 Tax=Caulobacter sp. NIBR2454 TaxID=3015996 RepID=UPI0022B6DB63|nr:alpha/beta hydrolase [Caulobacter sp. NIBR2454]
MQDPYVDPDTERLLARMAGDFAGAPAEPTVQERREGLAAAAALYGPETLPVGRIEDVIIDGPGGPLPLRIYYPVETRTPVPLLLHIHGGGWVLGDPAAYERVVRAYCAMGGCVVVDVDYRRAPENRFPAALLDCEAALAWAAANAERLGADPARIVVTGDSAGGHLSAGLCQRTSVPLAGQVLIYPVTSASSSADFASRDALGDGRWFLRHFDILRAEAEYFTTPAEQDTAAGSPLSAPPKALAKSPPTLVVTASLDPLVDEGRAYAQALEAAGVPTTYRCVEGTIHAFVLFAGQIALGREIIEQVGAFIRAA